MSENPLELQELALRLRQVDLQIVRAIAEQDVAILPELIEEFRKLKKDVQVKQIDATVSRVASPEARQVLRQIREERPFHAEKVFKVVDRESGEELPVDHLDDEDIEQLGSDLFYSWFGPYEYIERLYRLGSLLVTADVPERVLAYLSEARQCYAFQQYHAVLTLCRAFLEASARDMCVQLGLIGEDEDAILDPEERRFSRLIGAITKGSHRRRANSLYYGLASPVVHGVRSVSEAEAYRAVKDTLKLVEDLYQEHGLNVK